MVLVQIIYVSQQGTLKQGIKKNTTSQKNEKLCNTMLL
jgi:hypothetical protein